MVYRGPVHQWDVFDADLNFPVGSEQGGENRPVIVVSNDGFNDNFPVVTIVPLTGTQGKKRKVYPFEIVVPANLMGNPKESIIMPYQIRTIDKTRLREMLGHLEDANVRGRIEDRIIEHIGVDLDDDEEK
ncbi:MAG: type II toxin-antitoxin system PemK/MazF family toxin [Gemmatimonas sp.]